MPTDPASLQIVHYPAKVLLQRAKPVEAINADVRAVAKRMIELMYKAEGIGLAAPQVGLPWRMFVVDVPPPKDERSATDSSPDLPISSDGPRVYINPKLIHPEGKPEPMEEGCLSLPDIRGDVLRPPVITITAQDEHGRTFTETAAGLLARCWQHEMDHLDGVLIISKMTQMSRLKNRAAIKELEAEANGKPANRK